MKLIVMVSLFCLSLFAHTSTGHSGGFMSGMMHPIGGVDHILAMIGVGIVASFALQKTMPLVSFIGAMIAAAVLGYAGVAMVGIEVGILLSIAVIFAMIGYAEKLPANFIVIVIAVFGAFHGFAHGAEFGGGNFVAYIAGFAISTLALHILGMGLGNIYKQYTQKPQTKKAE